MTCIMSLNNNWHNIHSSLCIGNNISFSAANPQMLISNLSSISIDCPAICYNSLVLSYGSCPTNTMPTTITCTDIPSDGSMCTFALQTVPKNCRNSVDSVSDPPMVTNESKKYKLYY